jgi:hypothetical protein
MAIEFELAAFLASKVGVTGLVSTRIYVDRLPQKAARPAITYRLTGGERFYHTQGPSGLTKSTIAMGFHGSTPEGARALYDAVRLEVDGYSGTWGSTAVDHSTISTPVSTTGQPILGDEVGFPAVAAVVSVFHAESVPA